MGLINSLIKMLNVDDASNVSKSDKYARAEKLFYMGRDAAIRDDNQAAIRYYKESIALREDPAPIQGLAAVYIEEHRDREALELFEKAKRMRIKICPSDPEITTCNLMIAMIKNNSISD